jgi:hypothetical protein
LEARELCQRDVHCELKHSSKMAAAVYLTSSAISEKGGVSKLIENRLEVGDTSPSRFAQVFSADGNVPLPPKFRYALESIKHRRSGSDTRVCGPEPLLSRKNTTGAARSREQLLDR